MSSQLWGDLAFTCFREAQSRHQLKCAEFDNISSSYFILEARNLFRE